MLAKCRISTFLKYTLHYIHISFKFQSGSLFVVFSSASNEKYLRYNTQHKIESQDQNKHKHIEYSPALSTTGAAAAAGQSE
jgi:hypothetical protein